MARTPKDDRWLDDLFHLDDEEVVLMVQGELHDEVLCEHLSACDDCRARVEEARALMPLEPFRRRGEPARVARLMNRLTAIGAVAPERARSARIRVSLAARGGLRVLETDTEIHIRRAVAMRGVDPVGEPPGVTFFRQIGPLEIEVHLVRVPGGHFHLVVGVSGAEQEGRVRVLLHRRHRELAAQPLDRGAVTFKSLRPAAYRLEIQDRGVSVGFVDVDVEANSEVEGSP